MTLKVTISLLYAVVQSVLIGSFCQFSTRSCPTYPQFTHNRRVCHKASFQVSVYPKKELPFFILFTAGLCSFTALLALLTHQYPDSMGVRDNHFTAMLDLSSTYSQVIARTILMWVSAPLHYILEKADSFLPTSFLHLLSKM